MGEAGGSKEKKEQDEQEEEKKGLIMICFIGWLPWIKIHNTLKDVFSEYVF